MMVRWGSRLVCIWEFTRLLGEVGDGAVKVEEGGGAEGGEDVDAFGGGLLEIDTLLLGWLWEILTWRSLRRSLRLLFC